MKTGEPIQAKRPWVHSKAQVISGRAVLYGLALFGLLVALALFWRLAVVEDPAAKLKEFEFAVQEPIVEEFELSDPMRDILQERPEELPEEVQTEEKPDIHVSVVPTDVVVTEEMIQTQNIEVDAPDISVDATEVDIDSPEEITEASEMITRAVDPIAAAAVSPAEIFKYKLPVPRHKPRLHWINRAPRARRKLESLAKAFGDQETPSMGKLGPANINLFGTGDFLRTMTRWGGVKARSAVDSALHWLAVHQEPGGIWDGKKHEGQAGSDAGVSGLAVLALMGGGNTTRKGEYRRNVLRGVEALMKLQKPDGSIDKNIYCHSIATIALCESYGRARDERVGRAARKAVAYLEKGVNPDGGWRYTANCGKSDMSVTVWAIQALKTAKLARMKFDHSVYSRALTYADAMTDKGASRESTGAVGYQFQADQEYDESHPALTAAAMMSRQFSGVGVRSHLLVKGAELTRKQAPSWSRRDFYLWYYATYAMHNMGAEYRVWWNRRMRDVLVQNQCMVGDDAGSWDPKGSRWGGRGGRVYSTALGALCLEVYYRYSEALTSFGVAPDIDDLFLQ